MPVNWVAPTLRPWCEGALLEVEKTSLDQLVMARCSNLKDGFAMASAEGYSPPAFF
jgi:hypothetical protein